MSIESIVAGRRRNSRFASFSFLAVLALPGALEAEDHSGSPAVRQSARAASAYLARAVREDGSFEYRVDLKRGSGGMEKYNILRHAGTVYAMAQFHQCGPDPGLYLAIERAGRFLKRETMSPLDAPGGMLAVWSRPEIEGRNAPLQAKLGGSGLGLVALLEVEKVRPGFTELSELRSLGCFLLFMQREDGSFASKYFPGKDVSMSSWQSLYYPGEAALGLAMLYEVDPDARWLTGAVKGLTKLANDRAGKKTVPDDHWALLATARVLAQRTAGDLGGARDILVRHAEQISVAMLSDQVGKPSLQGSIFAGAFSKAGRIAPTATRLEGLQAALAILPDDHRLRPRIEEAVSKGIGFLIRAQRRDKEHYGAFADQIEPLGTYPLVPVERRQSANDIRIDYVQHSLSAMVQFLKDNEAN